MLISFLIFCIFLIADPLTILRKPCRPNSKVEPLIQRKIAAHLATQFGGNLVHMLTLVPEKMDSWSKVRVKDGDWIRTKSTTTNLNGRDQSFVRVSGKHQKKLILY